jgi:hypothetical protein
MERAGGGTAYCGTAAFRHTSRRRDEITESNVHGHRWEQQGAELASPALGSYIDHVTAELRRAEIMVDQLRLEEDRVRHQADQ